MPGFDGTGPMGMGPMTGGGRGFCSPWGIGAAGAYGFPRWTGYAPFSPQMTREEELGYLRDQAEGIKEQLEQIESRMRDLEAEK